LAYPNCFVRHTTIHPSTGSGQAAWHREVPKVLINGNEYGELETRNRIVIEAFKLFVYTQSEIGAHLELDKTTISKIVNKTN